MLLQIFGRRPPAKTPLLIQRLSAKFGGVSCASSAVCSPLSWITILHDHLCTDTVMKENNCAEKDCADYSVN